MVVEGVSLGVGEEEDSAGGVAHEHGAKASMLGRWQAVGEHVDGGLVVDVEWEWFAQEECRALWIHEGNECGHWIHGQERGERLGLEAALAESLMESAGAPPLARKSR